jgi:tRNA(Ile)-lysidine synthetase-like protein
MIKFSKEILQKAVELNDNRKEYVLMCSSGIDSVAGVHYMLSKVKNADIHRYKVVHYNHKLRPQNEEMRESVVRFINQKFPDFICHTVDRNIDNTFSEKTEANFRNARLNTLMAMYYHNIVISFHHLNDCVESYLLNWLRGHENYQPIPFWTKWEGTTSNVTCHPFVFTKKKDFIDYCVKHDLMKYVVEDETNTVSKGSRRNMIRNEIVPILQRDNVGLETIVAKKMKQRLMLDILK